MPGGDGTGPMGYGPMTGRGAGYCTGGYTNIGFGRGRGRGRGFGRGFFFGRGYNVPISGYFQQNFNNQVIDEKTYLEEEEAYLEQEKAYLENQLKILKNRLKGFVKEKE